MFTLSSFRQPTLWLKYLPILSEPYLSLELSNENICSISVASGDQALVAALCERCRTCKSVIIYTDRNSYCVDLVGCLESYLPVKEVVNTNNPSLHKAGTQNAHDLFVGIGANLALNEAKLAASQIKCQVTLALIPTSLATDSFLTNKFRGNGDNIHEPSHAGKYPDIVVFPSWVVRHAPQRVNFAGMGEGCALYSAVRDLLLTQPDPLTKVATGETTKILQWVMTETSNDSPSESSLHVIRGILLLKSLIMWAFNDCRWGAGSEHKIAYALSLVNKSNLLHGEACAFGTCFIVRYLSTYFPGIVDTSLLIELYKRFRLPMTLKDVGIDKHTLCAVIRNARKFRPARRTLVDVLEENRFMEFIFREI